MENLDYKILIPKDVAELLQPFPDSIVAEVNRILSMSSAIKVLEKHIKKITDYFVYGGSDISSIKTIDFLEFNNDIKWLIDLSKDTNYPLFARRDVLKNAKIVLTAFNAEIKKMGDNKQIIDIKQINETLDNLRGQWREIAQGIRQVERLGMNYNVDLSEIEE